MAFDPTGAFFARLQRTGKERVTVHVHRSDTGKHLGYVVVMASHASFALAPGGGQLLTWTNIAEGRDDPWPMSLWARHWLGR